MLWPESYHNWISYKLQTANEVLGPLLFFFVNDCSTGMIRLNDEFVARILNRTELHRGGALDLLTVYAARSCRVAHLTNSVEANDFAMVVRACNGKKARKAKYG